MAANAGLALSSALLACASPAKPAPLAPGVAQQSGPPAAKPKLDFTFDDEAIDSAGGFALDAPGATMLRVAADEERGGRVLAMSSVQTSVAGAGARAGLVLPPEAVAALRGRRVEVSASLDPNGAPPLFGMFGVDLQRDDDSLLRFRSAKTRDRGWETLRVVVDVPADAKNVGVWVYQSAEGELRLDDLHLRDVGPPGAGDVPPRAITARGMQNLLALARLYGAVRYFHPSDEATNADWDRLLLDAIEPVERAADARELAAQLTAIFQPVAPTMMIAAGDKAPPNEIPAAAPAADALPLRWRHFGVQMASSVAKVYTSERASALREPMDMLLQSVDVTARRGQTLELSAFLRIDGTQGVVVVATTYKEEEPAFAAVTPPAKPTQWTQVKLPIKIPGDAERLVVMVRMNGPGQIFLDDASLRGPDKQELLVNGDLEQDGGSISPVAWTNAFAAFGYEPRLESKGCHGGKRCASLTARPQPESRPGEAVTMQLPGGVTAEIPLVVWSRPAEGGPTSLPKGAGFRAAAQPHYAVSTDRSTRLASVMELWNVLQHFYPNFDVVKVDWMAQLPLALSAAAGDVTEEQLTETLERLTHELRDGHARVFPANGYRGELPIKLQLVEGRWMITGMDARALAQSGAGGSTPLTGGEELLSINGQPMDQLAAALRPRTSAATPQFEDVVVAQRLVAGDLGKSATVKLRRPSGEESTLQIAYALSPMTREVARPAPSTELEPGIWYVDAGELPEPFLLRDLPKMADARGLILDLRGYINRPTLFEHLIDKPTPSPWWLMPITTKPDREGTEFLKTNWAILPKVPKIAKPNGKVIVLADGRTLSGTETYLSIIKHHKLATIVGGASAGTNGDINPIALPSGHIVNWTGLRVQDPSGKPHHGAGVAPDVKVAPTVAGVKAGRDEILERGLELLRGPKPASPKKPAAATP